MSNPLLGRTIIFKEGPMRGIEGVVLSAELHGAELFVLLERIAHPALPAEPDGTNPVVYYPIDLRRDSFCVKPKPADDTIIGRIRAFFDISRRLSNARRGWAGETMTVEEAHEKWFKARLALEEAIGEKLP